MLAVENELVIIPAQDLLGLGSEARMNRPGTVNGDNWKWKLEQPLTLAQAQKLAGWTAAAGRERLGPEHVFPTGGRRSARCRRTRLLAVALGKLHARRSRAGLSAGSGSSR